MTKKAYLKIPFNVLFERDRKKTVTALFHLFPCRAIFCHPSHSQGLDAGAWKTAAITPSNFTYALHNGEKGKKSGMMAITYHSVRMQIIQMDKDNGRNQSTFNANLHKEIVVQKGHWIDHPTASILKKLFSYFKQTFE